MIVWQPGMTIDDMEKRVIEACLRYHNGNKTRTAQSLNIAIRTLDNKLARYRGEEPPISQPEQIEEKQ